MLHGRTLLCLFFLILGAGTACSDDGDTTDDGSDGEAGASGESGSNGSGGSSSGRGGSDQGGGSGESSGGTDTGGGGGEDTGGSSTGGSSTGGSSGGGGELDTLCEEMGDFRADKAAELDCMGSGVESEAEAWERICALSIDCVAELEDMNACWQSTSNWSCDTSDGHPQTNGDCPSDTFFACLGPSLHERDPFGCVVTQEAHNAAAEDVGCTPDDMVEFTCTQLYLRDLCTSEWETLVECLTADEPANLFECDTDGSLARQDGVCENETDAYDACIAG